MFTVRFETGMAAMRGGGGGTAGAPGGGTAPGGGGKGGGAPPGGMDAGGIGPDAGNGGLGGGVCPAIGGGGGGGCDITSERKSAYEQKLSLLSYSHIRLQLDWTSAACYTQFYLPLLTDKS